MLRKVQSKASSAMAFSRLICAAHQPEGNQGAAARADPGQQMPGRRSRQPRRRVVELLDGVAERDALVRPAGKNAPRCVRRNRRRFFCRKISSAMPGTASSSTASIASVSGPDACQMRGTGSRPMPRPKARNTTCAIASVVASAATEAAA